MTQEDKQLLLKDLCARLPYGVMVSVHGGEFDSYKYPYQLTAVIKFGLDNFCKVYHPIYTPFGVPKVEDVKPYLRLMSSMTEEENEEFIKLQNKIIYNSVGLVTDDVNEYKNFIYQHHLDDRRFIEKGLALEASEGIYKLNRI